jgi:hypothetical protein
MVIRAHHIRSYLSLAPAEGDGSDMTTGQDHDSGCYEIRVRGHLEPRWAAWFDGMSLAHEGDGTTVLHGPVVDQSALHGVLQKLRDLGLPLLAVTQLDPVQAHTFPSPPR